MAHRWSFVRAGGFDQVKLETGADLVALGELDQKLWVALACPVHHVDFDERTLELIDTDHDGRVRAGELIAAAKWIGGLVKDPEVLVAGTDGATLAWIDTKQSEGKLLVDTAKALLRSIGKTDATAITVDDVTKGLASFDHEPFNGDGIVPPESASDAATKQIIADAVACTTPRRDKSGKDGVGKAEVETFFKDIAAHADWIKAGDVDGPLRPLGPDTVDGHAAYAAVRAKIDDYFARTRVAAFDPRAAAQINGDEKVYEEIGSRTYSADAAEIAAMPLAQVAADKPLSLDRGLNPAWSARIATFRARTLKPAGADGAALTEAAWTALKARLEPYDTWRADQKGAAVAKLGTERVLELAAGDARAKVEAVVESDQAAEPLAAAIGSVERLVRYVRDLFLLANNFVAFRDFYARSGQAMFQAGRLFIDTRECELCVRVADAARHASMGPLSNSYLLYTDCKNAKGQTMQIAAVVSDGDVDNLMVGRNGVFYDRKGVDWDATITRIVENPISVRQAFWSPYKKVLRMIEEQIAKRASDAEKASSDRMTHTVHETAAHVDGEPTVAPAPAAAAPAAPRTRIDIGTVAALGVAVGGISAAIGGLLGHLFGLGFWMPLGLLGLVLAISGPSMAVAWLKLHKRNLGPILDANGWAVNAMARVNVPLGGSLTHLAELPKGSSRDLRDPFAEKTRPWGLYFVLIAILATGLAWYLGKLDRYLPQVVRSVKVLGRNAPAFENPRPAPAAPAAPAPH